MQPLPLPFLQHGFTKSLDDALEATSRSVSALTTTNLAALGAYNIAQADVTELDGLASRFHGLKTAPRTAIAGRKGETDTLPDLITSTTSILRNRLDKLMTKFKKTNPEFFAGYRSARVIVDRGGTGGPGQPPPTPPPAPPH